MNKHPGEGGKGRGTGGRNIPATVPRRKEPDTEMVQEKDSEGAKKSGPKKRRAVHSEKRIPKKGIPEG